MTSPAETNASPKEPSQTPPPSEKDNTHTGDTAAANTTLEQAQALLAMVNLFREPTAKELEPMATAQTVTRALAALNQLRRPPDRQEATSTETVVEMLRILDDFRHSQQLNQELQKKRAQEDELAKQRQALSLQLALICVAVLLLVSGFFLAYGRASAYVDMWITLLLLGGVAVPILVSIKALFKK